MKSARGQLREEGGKRGNTMICLDCGISFNRKSHDFRKVRCDFCQREHKLNTRRNWRVNHGMRPHSGILYKQVDDMFKKLQVECIEYPERFGVKGHLRGRIDVCRMEKLKEEIENNPFRLNYSPKDETLT